MRWLSRKCTVFTKFEINKEINKTPKQNIPHTSEKNLVTLRSGTCNNKESSSNFVIRILRVNSQDSR